MSKQEVKTGQHIDSQKADLLSPAVVKEVLSIPNIPRNISVIDVGSGDGSSSMYLMEALIQAGLGINNLAFVDVDMKIFPNIVLKTLNSNLLGSVDKQLVEGGSQGLLQEFLEHYENHFDVATAQLVLHQVLSDPEMSYLIYIVHHSLQSAGNLFVIDLHPQYIDYLIKHEPRKFKTLNTSQSGIEGEYYFDSGGKVHMCSRKIEELLSRALGMGFDFVKLIPVMTAAIADRKQRYQRLTKNNIPMFYVMHLRKNEANFVSSTQGVVANIQLHHRNIMRITFADEDQVWIPKLGNWQSIKNGSRLILHEIYRREIGMTVLNYWAIPSHPNMEFIGGQMLFKTEV